MPVKTIRAVTLAILFLVALALAFLSFALLLLAVVLCIFFALLAFLAAPEETKAFVRGSRDTVDACRRRGPHDGGVDGEVCRRGGAGPRGECGGRGCCEEADGGFGRRGGPSRSNEGRCLDGGPEDEGERRKDGRRLRWRAFRTALHSPAQTKTGDPRKGRRFCRTGGREGIGTQASASGDSGRICPPSTTILCPVM